MTGNASNQHDDTFPNLEKFFREFLITAQESRLNMQVCICLVDCIERLQVQLSRKDVNIVVLRLRVAAKFLAFAESLNDEEQSNEEDIREFARMRARLPLGGGVCVCVCVCVFCV